ncbi:MAG: hypothetical protein OXH00_14920 [Candidatus Poribacteria bacterium]|nr:hypothetical protein [Candidatus Poribacteria bacterium]
MALQFKRLWKSIGTYLVLGCILFLTFWIRIQGVENIPPGQFTENDAFLYASQVSEILKRRVLPPKDMHRWLPFGRDNQQLLSLYSYAIAYIHRLVGGGFPNSRLTTSKSTRPLSALHWGLGSCLSS